MKKVLLFSFWNLLFLTQLYAQVPDPFPKLTRWVDKAPVDLIDNLPALCDHLLSRCENDTQKAWVIYRWISRNISYDDQALQKDQGRINKNIQDILTRQKALCFGYAQLFVRMCEEADLPAVLICGYSKGTLTAQANLDTADHAWNAVQLDGQWALLDATWGSSLIQGTNDFVQTYQEGYFLTTPEKFLINHLPLQPMWQLLDCPLQASVFNAPPDTILTKVSNQPACFNFQDSIEAFLSLSLAEQKYIEAQMAYAFNPTPNNQSVLGHALVDYATRTSDQSESYKDNEPDKWISLQKEAVQALKRAHTLIKFFDWQKEFYADLLVNLSVFQYNDLDPAAYNKQELKQVHKNWIEQLQLANSLLKEIVKSYMAGQKIRACNNYEQVIQEELDRLNKK